METTRRATRVINPDTRIGHVHLKVANIERALGFYRDTSRASR
jgi:catechol-2,3-dioxygenase